MAELVVEDIDTRKSLRPSSSSNIMRRMVPLLVAAWLQSFVLWYAIEKPFLDGIGLSSTQMATLVVIFNVAMTLTNVPLGLIADRWSRRKMLMVGGVALALSSVDGALSHGFSQYVVAVLCYAIYQATYSGSYDAAVYDLVVEETGTGDLYTRVYGRLRLVEGVGLAISSLAGGLAAALWTPTAAYWASVPFALLSIVALTFFDEPTHHKHQHSADPHRLTSTLGSLLRQRYALAVILSTMAAGMGLSFLAQLDQLWLLAVDFPLALYGPVNAALLACYSLGGFVAGRGRPSERRDMTTAAVFVAASIALLFRQPVLIVVSQCVAITALMALMISLGQRLHDLTPSRVRSSVSSAVGTAGMMAFAPIAVLFGHIAQTQSVFVAARIPVVVAVLMLLAIATANRLHRTLT